MMLRRLCICSQRQLENVYTLIHVYRNTYLVQMHLSTSRNVPRLHCYLFTAQSNTKGTMSNQLKPTEQQKEDEEYAKIFDLMLAHGHIQSRARTHERKHKLLCRVYKLGHMNQFEWYSVYEYIRLVCFCFRWRRSYAR